MSDQRPPIVINSHSIAGQRVRPMLRIGEVCDLLNVSRTTLRRWVREGEFPQPKRLSPQIHVWERQAIQEWLGTRE